MANDLMIKKIKELHTKIANMSPEEFGAVWSQHVVSEDVAESYAILERIIMTPSAKEAPADLFRRVVGEWKVWLTADQDFRNGKVAIRPTRPRNSAGYKFDMLYAGQVALEEWKAEQDGI